MATPQQLANASACFCGLSQRELLQVFAYASAVNAGLSTNPDTLAILAKEFDGLSEKQLLEVIAYAVSSGL